MITPWFRCWWIPLFFSKIVWVTEELFF